MAVMISAFIVKTHNTVWINFLSLDDTLDESTIESAMERAQDGHDANIGFNWDSLQSAIDEVKSV